MQQSIGLSLIILLSLGVQDTLWAQKSKTQQECTAELGKMISSYEAGAIDAKEVYLPVRECLDRNNFGSRDEKLKAYKYLILIYLYLNENTEAEGLMKEFMKYKLKKEPEYDPRVEAPESGVPEFIQLYQQFRSWPIFYFGPKIGGTLGLVETSQNFSVDRSDEQRWAYSSQLRGRVGMVMEFPFGGVKRSFSLMPELHLSQVSYQYQDRLLNFANLRLTEVQNRLEVPLMLKYHFKRQSLQSDSLKIKNRVQPFIQVGGGLAYTFSAKLDPSRLDDLNAFSAGGGVNRSEIRPEGNASIDLLQNPAQRQVINYSLMFGGGFRFRNFLSSGGDLVVEGRFEWGMNNQVRTENRGANPELVYTYGFIDHDFKLHQISFSLSYLFPKYSPKALKKSTQLYDFDPR